MSTNFVPIFETAPYQKFGRKKAVMEKKYCPHPLCRQPLPEHLFDFTGDESGIYIATCPSCKANFLTGENGELVPLGAIPISKKLI
jgi:hypothetical protein